MTLPPRLFVVRDTKVTFTRFIAKNHRWLSEHGTPLEYMSRAEHEAILREKHAHLKEAMSGWVDCAAILADILPILTPGEPASVDDSVDPVKVATWEYAVGIARTNRNRGVQCIIDTLEQRLAMARRGDPNA